MFKKKNYTLPEVVKIISDFVEGEIKENQKIRTDFENKKEAVFKQITDVLDQVKLKQKGRNQKVAELNTELAALIKQQNDLTDKLILNDDPVALTALEEELTSINMRRSTLETKIKAFSNNQSFLTPEERKYLNQKMSEYDSYSNSKLNSLLNDNNATFQTLKAAIPNPKPSKSMFELMHSTRVKEDKAIDKLIQQNVFSLLSNGTALELLKKQKEPEHIFERWLSSNEDISFSEYIPKFIKQERLEQERLERAEQERKSRERMERDAKNEQVMANIDRRLGQGTTYPTMK